MDAGLFKYLPVKNQPADAESWLAAQKGPLNAGQVSAFFSDCAPESVTLNGISFSEDGWGVFQSELAKSMTIEALSLSGCKGSVLDLVNSLVENFSIRRLDLHQCQLKPDTVDSITSNVVQWNKSIISWDLSDNPDLGTDSVTKMFRAFAEHRSAVQTISIAGCGVTDFQGIIDAALVLPSLIQVDFSRNPGFPSEPLKAKVSELEEVLKRNFQLLHPNDQLRFESILVESKESPSSPNNNNTQAQARKPRTSMVKQSPQRARGQSLKQENKPTLPPKREEKPKEEPAQQQPSQQRKAPEKEKEKEKAPEKEAAPEKQPEKAKEEPAKENQNSNARAESKPKESNASQARNESPAPNRSQSASRGRSRQSPSVRIDPIDAGMERWIQVKQQYNQFIRSDSPNKKLMTIHREQPKFCLGKRIDQIKDRPSPCFKTGVTRTAERAPTPKEIRTLAPWVKGEETKASTGSVYRTRGEDGSVITFVNGGDVTCISDDPRDVGYLARKVAAGLAHPKPTLFMSNTPRELRWGVSEGDGSFLPKQSQAPPPGHYTVVSEWEKKVKKARETSRATSATGRPAFGGSACPRFGMQKKSDGPDPGQYEIP